MNEAVKSAARVLDLLELFAVSTEPIGVTELARLVSIPKSSAQALLGTLVARGYLARTGSAYELARDLKRSGWVGGSLPRLIKAAEPAMRRMADASGESAFLSLMTPSGELKYVAKAVSPNVVRYDAPLTNTRPAYCTSSGVILLAYLPPAKLDEYFARVKLERRTPNTVTDRRALMAALEKARRLGYADVCDGHVQGASGVSAPIFDGGERPVAALTLVAPTVRFAKARSALRDHVVAVAAELSRTVQPKVVRIERAAA